MGFVVGIDVGGTFTDGVAIDGSGRIVSAKSRSEERRVGKECRL